MSYAILYCDGQGATISSSVSIEPEGGSRANKLISFPGMTGHEVLKGEALYQTIKITGWIEGTSLSLVHIAMDALCDKFINLAGRDKDSIKIWFGDGSTIEYSNIIGHSVPQFGRAMSKPGVMMRPVTFSVRKVR